MLAAFVLAITLVPGAPGHAGSLDRPTAAPAAGFEPVGPPAIEAATPVRYSYDAAGRLVGLTAPDGEAARYEYDEAGNLLQVERLEVGDLAVFSLVPARAPVGAEVRIEGTGFGTDPVEHTVEFGSASASVVSATEDALTVEVPAGASNGPVSVTTGGATASSPEAFVVEQATSAPEVTEVSPQIGSPGSIVTITGGGFDPDPAGNVVQFEQTRAVVTAASADSLTVEIPAAAGSGRVTVKTAGGTGVSSEIFVVPPPGYTPAQIGDVVSVTTDGVGRELTLAGSGAVGLVLFTGEVGQQVGLGFTDAEFTQGFASGVFTPTGQPFGRDQFDVLEEYDGDGSLALPPLPTTGTYQAIVDPFSGAGGTVTAWVSTTDTDGQIDPTDGGGITLDRPGRHADLSFAADPNQRLTMWVDDRTLPSGTQLTATVFDPYGAVLADVLLPNGAHLEFVTGTAGDHRVRIGAADAATGSGTVRIGTASDAQPLAVDGAAVPVSISAGVLSELRFDAVAGQQVDLGFTGWQLGALERLRARVFGPDGEVVADHAFGDGFSMTALPAVTGEHRLLLSGDDGAVGGVTVSASSQVDAGAITVGTAVTVGNSRPGQSIALGFAGEQGQRLAVVLDGSSFPLVVRAQVFDADGQRIANVADLRQLPLPPLPDGGDYTLVVDGYSSTGAVALRLQSAVAADELTPEGDPAVFPLGQAGLVGSATFAAVAGERLSLAFTDSTFSNANPPRATVLGPDGVALPQQDWLIGTGAVLNVEVTTTGDHTLVIGAPSNQAGVITATLSLPQELGQLTPGAPVPVTIDRVGQLLLMELAGEAGDRFTLEFADLAFGFLPQVVVYHPDGTVHLEAEGAALVQLDLPADGVYLISASPYASTGSATVMLWQHTDGGALPVDGASAVASLAAAGEAVEFTIDAQAGQRVGFGFSGWGLPADAILRTILAAPSGVLYQESNWLLAEHTTFELTIAESGPHRLFLAVADNVTTGAVTATVSTEVDLGTIATGSSREISIERPGQPVRMRFSGTAGQQMTLAFSNFTIAWLPRVVVFRPDGGILTSHASATTMTFTLLQDGTHEVVITTYSSTGSVTASLATGTAAAPSVAGETPGVGQSPVAPPARPKRPGADRPVDAGATAPAGEEVPQATDLRSEGRQPTVPMREPRQAPLGMTAVSGEVRTADDQPLPGVTVSIGSRRTGTDHMGQFLLVGVPAGQQELAVDGTRVGDDISYGLYHIGVDVVAGRTTALPAPSWLTPIDSSQPVRLPASEPVVLTHPDVPGLEIRIPAGVTAHDRAGNEVHELSLTPVPVDRPPFPLPSFPVPTYFTVQPGGVVLSGDGAQIVYPNYTGAPAGVRADFWQYTPDGHGWHRYGHGRVTADADQVVPDPYVRVRELTGAMINDPAQPMPPAQAPPRGSNAVAGDPVDLATGLMLEEQTDLVLDDILPIHVTRSYRQGDDAEHAFGVGTTLAEFGMRLYSDHEWAEADLILPDGGKVHFSRITPGVDTFTDAVFAADPTPTRFHGSLLVWNGNGWDLRMRDGLTYVFGDEAPLQAIHDQHGNTITITRVPGVMVGGIVRANGPISQVTSPSGKWVRFDYDDAGRITSAEDNLGRTVAYAYHDEGARDGHLAEVTDADGGVTAYAYETYQDGRFSRARLATITDPRGTTFLTNEYDAAGRVVTQTQPDGSTYEFAYTETGGRVSQTVVTDPRGHQRRVEFDPAGYSVTDTAAVGTPQEQPLQLERDPESHRIVATVDALERRTEFSYDPNGQLHTVVRLPETAAEQTHTYQHDGPFDQLTQLTDPLGHTTTLSYHDTGVLASVTDPAGRTVTFDHDLNGRITEIVNPLGHTTQFDYQAGDLVAVTDPLSRTVTVASDVAGRITAVTDPQGATTRYAYDDLDQLHRITDPLGHETSLSYNANGYLTEVVDPRGGTTSYTYDAMDRVESRTDPTGAIESYAHDSMGNLTEVVSRRGIQTEYDYDQRDRLVQARYGVTGGDADSETSFTYDAVDRLVGIDDSVAGLLGFAYDGLDRLVEATSVTGTVGYGHDLANRRTSMTVAGQESVSYGYNDAGDLVSITETGQQVEYSYDAAGRIDTVDLPGGWSQVYGLDPAGQPISIDYRHGGASLGTLSYAYHRDGTPARVSGDWARALLPDAFGPATYDAANRPVTVDGVTFTHDADGNLTGDGERDYSYDARGQLVQLTADGQSAGFTYDGAGRRAATTIDGDTRHYLYDGDNPVQELAAADLPAANLLTGGLDVFYSRTTSAGTDTYLRDALGSTLALAGADGTVTAEYSYEPFGATAVVGADHGNRHQFTGRENDGTGLYHYRNRYYHPQLQRFISEDPIGFAGGDPNLYRYVGNQPTRYTDPYGLKPQPRFQAPETNRNQVACAPGNSFTPETRVMMADGSSKPIAEVSVGEQVLAGDPGTGQTHPGRVTALIEGEGPKDLVEVTVAAQPAGQATVVATDGHPFWSTTADEWVDAVDLVPGDGLVTTTGDIVEVTEVEYRTADQPVHNLTVADHHTYYVVAGTTPVLVHNTNAPIGCGLGGAPIYDIPSGSSGGPGAGQRIPAGMLEDYNIGVRANSSSPTPLCSYCRTNRATSIDHVEPRVRGGDLTDTNTTPACTFCNSSKGARGKPSIRLQITPVRSLHPGGSQGAVV